MTRPIRAILRFVLCVSVIGTSAIASSSGNSASQSNLEVARGLPEVRLRKLHLVRPDLIQYPLLVEVVC